jgi:hypothetical protein
VAEIKEFPNFIYNGKFHGPNPRCGGPATRSGPRWTTGGARHTGAGLAGARRWAQQGEGDMGNSIGCSPGHGRQQGGLAMEENDGGGRWPGERLAQAKKEAEDRVRRGGAVWGCSRWLL